MSAHTTRRRDRLRTLLRREHGKDGGTPLADTGLLQAPAVAVEGRGADGSPLVRDAIGVRPATAGEMNLFAGGWDTPAARGEAAAIFGPGAHGIATAGTLAGIQAEADREAEAARQAEADQAAARAETIRMQLEYDTTVRAEAEAFQRARDDRETVRRNRPYTDTDPTLVDTEAARWAPPVPAPESASRIARLTYPPPDGTREQYAAMARQVSAFTGTRSRTEQPAGWPAVFRTAGPGRPVMAWDADRPPLLALPAGTGATA